MEEIILILVILSVSLIIMIIIWKFFNNERKNIIIEKEKLEEKLRLTEEKYNALFESSQDAILLLDPEKGYLDCNNAALKLFNIPSKTELYKLSPIELSPKYQPDGTLSNLKAKEMITKAIENGFHFFEWTHKKYNGDEFPATVLANILIWNNRKILQGTIRDNSRYFNVLDQLKKESDFSNNLLNETPTLICGMTAEGICSFINPAVEKTTGYTKDEILGENWWEVLHPSEEHVKVEDVIGDINKGIVKDYEMLLTTKDKRKRIISWNLLIRSNDSSKLREIIGYGYDITERMQSKKEAEEAQAILEGIFNSTTTVGFIMVDECGIIKLFSRGTEIMLGYSSEEVVDKMTPIPFHIDSELNEFYSQVSEKAGYQVTGFDAFIEAINLFGERSSEWTWIRKDGDYIKILLTTVIIKNPEGNIIGRIGIVNDITKQKEIEEELKTSNDELQSIVYVASHDLRSPLVNIEGFSTEMLFTVGEIDKLLTSKFPNLLESEKYINSKNDLQESLELIKINTSKIDILLKGLLKLSKIGNGGLVFETIDMNRLISTIVKGMQYQIDKAKVNIIIGNLPKCNSDLTLTGQIISNLIDNAIKYLDPNRDGEIKITGQKMNIDFIQYCIEDNGLGIKKEDQKKIFELFYRLNPESEIDGVGIGLTIIQKMLKKLNGTIEVESSYGKGSKFYFTLPIVKNNGS